MGDMNLKNDKFFHNLIKTSEDRMIPIDILKNCARIKKHSTKDEDLIEAI